MLKRTLSLSGALLALFVLRAVLVAEDVATQWRWHVPEIDRHLAQGELRTYALYAALATPAAFLLHAAFSGPAYARVAHWAERAGYWAPALSAALFAFCLSRLVTQGAWYTDDEQAYLFQMQTYAQLKLTIPAIEPEGYFHHPFVLVTRVKDGVRQWAGIYPFMQPGLMALSRWLGNPLLSQWLCAGLIAWNTGRLAERLTERRALGIVAAWLVVASPGLIGLAATYHTAVLGCLLSLLAVRALLWTRDAPSFVRGALLGACTGATFLTRGLEGTLLVLLCGSALALGLVRVETGRVRLGQSARPTLFALLGYSLAGLVALGAYVAVNRATTGDWLRHTYAVWEVQYGRIMGFGSGMMWGRTHTPLMGLAQTATSLARMNFWLFGWPVSLALPLLALLQPFRTRAVLLLLTLSALQLAGYVLLPFGSVHDFGSAYHIWHVPWIACVAVLFAKNARALLPSVTRFYVALSCVGLLGFWPTQLQKWYAQANDILAPVRAVDAARKGQQAVVLYSAYPNPAHASWVGFAPAPAPENGALWMIDASGAEQIARSVLPARKLLRFAWENNVPTVRPVP
jgi:hypothetical protein